MKILCIEGRSQYRLMNSFLDAFVDAFEQHGHDVVRRRWDDTDRPRVDLVYSFGGVGRSVQWDAPFLTWLVDSPVYTPGLSARDLERDGVFVVAREHVAVAGDFLGLDVATGFMPHGIAVDESRLPSFADDDRPIDVLIAGSYQPEPAPRLESDIPQLRKAVQRLGTLAEERWDNHMRELEVTALFRTAGRSFDVPASPTVHRFVAPALAWLDEHLRLRRRSACVRALDAAGIRLHVAGAGWEQLELEHAVLLGQMDHGKVLDVVREAKVVCNVGPPIFNGGWHERIPMAMAGGAHVVTENNDFIAADTELCSLITRYEMRDYEQLADVVRGAIEEPDRTDRARAAYDVACANHTWAHRARAILDAVEI